MGFAYAMVGNVQNCLVVRTAGHVCASMHMHIVRCTVLLGGSLHHVFAHRICAESRYSSFFGSLLTTGIPSNALFGSCCLGVRHLITSDSPGPTVWSMQNVLCLPESVTPMGSVGSHRQKQQSRGLG